LRTVRIIERKREGLELSRDEIEHIVLGYVREEVPDYQVAAWLMAVCCRGMSRRETLDLTETMLASGAILNLSGMELPVADKHSSGGVGDKVTLVVAPLVRACGVAVGKMSGRGLGFTGGTLDKLESIPGFNVELTGSQFLDQLQREGIVVSGQTPELVPADRRLYALRDVTGTVQSLPLIASSIMSKKLAVGAMGLALEITVGSGALVSSLEEARQLARLMVEIGTAAGKRVSAVITPMDEPLGWAVGNALEVAEAIETLRGGGPADLRDLCAALAGEMLWLVGAADGPEHGRKKAEEALLSGSGLEWLRRWIATQGGDPRVVEDPSRMGRAPLVKPVHAPRAGWVRRVDARGVAEAALTLGAGRAKKEDSIDHRVGVVLKAKTGDEVARGEPLAEIHARDAGSLERALQMVSQAYALGDDPSSRAGGLERYCPDVPR